MTIDINGKSTNINSDVLQDVLVEHFGKIPGGVAAAVNNEVIPKSEWEKHKLSETDKVLIITATQGG